MMKRWWKFLFEPTKKPKKGLLAAEWVIMGYLLFTLLLMAFMTTKVVNPESMLWGRLRIVVMTVALWAVYRLVPCRLMLLARVVLQMALLSWWYPDTYELNRLLPNLDPTFARLEQTLFGCQPALLFARQATSAVVSELLYLGYASYYPLIAVVALYYFFRRYAEFGMASFVILASFFVYYVIFVLVPVTGPQYYYLAAGTDQIAAGVFPDVGDYFLHHQESLPLPGWSDGLFYHAVEAAHNTGERPTAAFPSSHVGVTTILLLLAIHSRSRKLTGFLLPFYVLMCLATVYIRAHYAVDVLGGWVSAVVFYFALRSLYVRRRLDGKL